MTTGMSNVPPLPPAEVMSISLASRIPEFWMDQPRVWFIRVEAILAPQKMGDDSKFDLVVSKLPKEVIMQLTDFLTKPPETGKFLAIKTKLLTLFEDSKNRQIEKLIGEMELGDQKPSQLLQRMRSLAHEKIPDDTLRVLWQSHLPATMRAVLVASACKDLDTLAMIADNVAEATRSNHISAITQTSREQSKNSDIASISAQLAKMNARITTMERSRSRTRQQGNFYRHPSRSKSRRRNPESPDWLCKYHFRYRQRAHRCEPPCAWKINNTKTGDAALHKSEN